jgi:isovaleryl-CoA dehydrogenase
MVRQFVEKEVEPQANDFNKREEFNHPLFKKLGGLGLLGITAPVEYGGSGMDAVAACIAHEELSASDPAFCLSYLAHSMLFVNNLVFNGNHDQKSQFLPDACSGKRIGGMCMSEPGAGTDVLGMATTAKKEGNNWRLNGTKMWITNGAVNDTELGDMFLVYAKTAEKGWSLFLVEKGTPGFSLGQRIKDKCGIRASGTAELVFEDVVIPKENLVGAENGALICMMRNLEIERVTLAAMSLGIARRCIEVMNQYGKDRAAFGQPINRYGQIQRHIAESYGKYMAGRTYTYGVAGAMKLDKPGNRLDTDGVKLFCAPMAKEVADSAIQVLGGNGYVGEYKVERLWRDAKLIEIGGGTIESHHKNMTRDLAGISRLE